MRELQSLVNGVGLGALYALVGLAAAFVLRVTKIMNFAVGGIVVLAGLFAASSSGLPPALRLILLLLVGAPAGVLVHLVSTRWLEGRSQRPQEHDLGGVLVTVALATALQGLGYLLFGSDLRYATSVVPAATLSLGGGITVTTGTILLVAAVALGGTSLLGGRGGLFGPVLGAASIFLLGNILISFQVNPSWLQVVYGVMLMISVVLVASASRATSGVVK